jgi:hypothetical protein
VECVSNLGADRDLEQQICSLLTRAIIRTTWASIVRADLALPCNPKKRIFMRDRFKNNAPARATVPAIRTSLGHVFLAVEGAAAVTPAPGLNLKQGFIAEHSILAHDLQ